MWPHSQKTAKFSPCWAVSVLLVGIVPNPYAEQGRRSQRHSRCSDVFLSGYPKSLHQNAKTAGWKTHRSGVGKATPGGIENTGFFAGVGVWQGVYISSPENGGHSFYIAPLSGTLAYSPKSARQPTHLGLVQRPVAKASKRRSHRE